MMPVADIKRSTLKLMPQAASPGDAENRRGGSLLIVDFAQDGNSAAYRTFGWSGQEDSYVWSVLSASGLRLPPRLDDTPLTIEIDCNIPVGASGLGAAVLRVFANGYAVGAVSVTGWTRVRCDMPRGLIAADEPIELRFEHPCYVRTDCMGFGHDDRPLGLCVYAVRVYPPWMKSVVDCFALMPPLGRLVLAPVPSPPRDEPARPVLYRFSLGQPGRGLLREGWMHDEQGDAWSMAQVCSLELPAPEAEGPYLARFSLCPLTIRNARSTQRITILLSGAVIGQFALGTDTSLVLPVPPELFRTGDVLVFTFVVPDGLPMEPFDPAQQGKFLGFVLDSIEIMPVPPRHAALALMRGDDVTPPESLAVSDRFLDAPVEALPGAVKAALGIDIADILKAFESLGDNCAFGLAQRKGGCEVLGLLRFANTPLNSLMDALADAFDAITTPSELTMRRPHGEDGEHCLYADRYGIRWHTNVFGGTSDEATIFAQQAMRLAYLRRKFYEALRAGRKIATVSRAEPLKHPVPMPYAEEPAVWEEWSENLRFAEIVPLFLRLNEYGANTLLYLTRCANERRSGTVELLAPGVMRGYMDDFVITPEPEQQDHAAWLRVAVNAWLLDQGPNAAFRKEATP